MDGSLWIPEDKPIPSGFVTVPIVTVSGMITVPIPGHILIRPETVEEQIQREAIEEVNRIAPGWNE